MKGPEREHPASDRWWRFAPAIALTSSPVALAATIAIAGWAR